MWSKSPLFFFFGGGGFKVTEKRENLEKREGHGTFRWVLSQLLSGLGACRGGGFGSIKIFL